MNHKITKKRCLSYLYLVLSLSFLASGLCSLTLHAYRQVQANRVLIQSLKADDTVKGLLALQEGADPDICEQDAREPSLRSSLVLLWQRMWGDKSTASHSSTALLIAVEQNNTVLVKALLSRGAHDIQKGIITVGDEANIDVSVPLLTVAVTKKNNDIVQSLVNYGSDVNAVDENGQTPLFYAEDASTMEVLIKCGANIAATSPEGFTALDHHVDGDRGAFNAEVAKVLINHGACDAKALLLAAHSAEDHEILQSLLKTNLPVDMLDQAGETPLQLALGPMTSEQVRREVVLTLTNQQLNRSIIEEYRHVVLLLIKETANLQNKCGDESLLLASAGSRYTFPAEDNRWVTVLNALVEHGAYINTQDTDGRTPLMIAAWHLRPDLVEFLLYHGASVNMHSKTGETALSMVSSSLVYGREKDRVGIIRMLKAAGAL